MTTISYTALWKTPSIPSKVAMDLASRHRVAPELDDSASANSASSVRSSGDSAKEAAATVVAGNFIRRVFKEVS